MADCHCSPPGDSGGEETNCVICCEALDGSSTVIHLVGCNHAFHRLCLRRMLRFEFAKSPVKRIDLEGRRVVRLKCPLCRSRLVYGDVKSLQIRHKLLSMRFEFEEEDPTAQYAVYLHRHHGFVGQLAGYKDALFSDLPLQDRRGATATQRFFPVDFQVAVWSPSTFFAVKCERISPSYRLLEEHVVDRREFSAIEEDGVEEDEQDRMLEQLRGQGLVEVVYNWARHWEEENVAERPQQQQQQDGSVGVRLPESSNPRPSLLTEEVLPIDDSSSSLPSPSELFRIEFRALAPEDTTTTDANSGYSPGSSHTDWSISVHHPSSSVSTARGPTLAAAVAVVPPANLEPRAGPSRVDERSPYWAGSAEAAPVVGGRKRKLTEEEKVERNKKRLLRKTTVLTEKINQNVSTCNRVIEVMLRNVRDWNRSLEELNGRGTVHEDVLNRRSCALEHQIYWYKQFFEARGRENAHQED